MAKAKQLPSGAWRVQVYCGKQNGKNVYKSFTSDDKKEAQYLAFVCVIFRVMFCLKNRNFNYFVDI